MLNSITIAKKEIKDIIKDKVFLVLVILFVIITWISIFMSWEIFKDQVNKYMQSLALLQSIWKASSVSKPELYPLDLLRWVVNYIEMIWAILWIFLWYLTIYKERVNNTFKLFLTRQVKEFDIFLGKLIWNTVIVSIIMFVIIFMIILFLWVLDNAILGIIDYIKLLLFFVSSVIYIMCFYLISFTFAIYSKNIINSLIASFLVWLWIVLILPQIWDTMDTSNQVSWWFFKTLNLSRSEEKKLMQHFWTYEFLRWWTEQLSIEKHYERLNFALFWIKWSFKGKSLWYIISDRRIDIYVLVLSFIILLWLSNYIFRKKVLYQNI